MLRCLQLATHAKVTRHDTWTKFIIIIIIIIIIIGEINNNSPNLLYIFSIRQPCMRQNVEYLGQRHLLKNIWAS